MKKYKIFYIIIYLALALVVLTKGIELGIEFSSYDDYLDSGIIDGFMGTRMLLILNFIIMMAIFIVSLVITITKKNTIKYKWWIFIGIMILSLLVPTFLEHRSGGIAGINEKVYSNILMIKLSSISLK